MPEDTTVQPADLETPTEPDAKATAEEVVAEKETPSVPDNDFYVEFRVMYKPFPHEAWSDWFLYPSGASVKYMREALKKEGAVMFADDLEEVRDAIRVDTMLNAKFLELPNEVMAVRQDSQQIKNDLEYGPWDKIPVRFAPSIQVRLMENNVNTNMNPMTIADMYENMTGLPATEGTEKEGGEEASAEGAEE